MKKFFPALVAIPPTTLYSFCKGYGFADSHKVSGNPSSHILCGNGILLEILQLHHPSHVCHAMVVDDRVLETEA